MIVKTFEVRDFKHLLEANGHNPDRFINPYLDEFNEHKAAMGLVMDQVAEVENERKSAHDLEKKLKNKVSKYMQEADSSVTEINKMTDKDNKGQYQDFEVRHYRYNRANRN